MEKKYSQEEMNICMDVLSQFELISYTIRMAEDYLHLTLSLLSILIVLK